MSEIVLQDQSARERVLDITQSIIVQAPAGSGKTSLLTNRFLKLLVTVENPEEIIAMTFTRKAASEMRSRIVEALIGSDANERADVRAVAAMARARDAEKGWRLVENPSRLRIHTLDAFCFSLTRQLPWTSGFGAPPGILENEEVVYRDTVRRFVARFDDEEAETQAALAQLLTHFDNDARRIEAMLIRMLSLRDQWADKVVGADAAWRHQLEDVISRLVVNRLSTLQDALERVVPDTLFPLVRFAASHVSDGTKPSFDGSGLVELESFPDASVDALPVWQSLAALLLTAGSKDHRTPASFRKRLTLNEGFPTKTKLPEAAALKKQMSEMLDELRDADGLADRIDLVRRLPGGIDEDQWQFLAALKVLLPRLLAELHLGFTRAARVDYTEVSLRAVAALGDALGPSDLALRLDHTITHVLVDEFQDTSSTQFDLVAKLTHGWEPGDGRTLFVVGDPMQSIYRFRKAEVQLFLNVWDNGVGALSLNAEQISVNFRSQAGIVEWVNRAFGSIFPAHSNAVSGAVSYAPSTAAQIRNDDDAVQFFPFARGDLAAEAMWVVDIVRFELKRDESSRVAILVRNRSHLAHIVPQLQKSGIEFKGRDLVRLWDREIVQDLFALTRVCQHPGDRVAWLAALRAPWCGLRLHDLHVIANADSEPDATILESINREDGSLWDALEEPARLARVRTLFNHAIDERRRGSLRRLIEWLWIELGGPACIEAPAMADAEGYFDLLESMESGGVVPDMSALEQRLKVLFASPRSTAASDRVHIMTIHAAKGLEFEAVILPQLGARARSDEARMLELAEVSTGDGDLEFLIAPRPRSGTDKDALYELTKRFNRERADNEVDRLLYVACTRAKSRLYLLGSARYQEKNEAFKPENSSFLSRLWHLYGDAFNESDALREAASTSHVGDSPADKSALPEDRTLLRLPSGWQPPAPLPVVMSGSDDDGDVDNTLVEYSWAGEEARQLGIVVHDALMALCAEGESAWTDARKAQAALRWRSDYRRAGAAASDLDRLVDWTAQAITNTASDKTGRWIISSQHEESQTEYALTVVVDGFAERLVVDRTFIDEHGVRWIIDYKTSRHAGGNLEAFLEQEKERYIEQLSRYAKAFSMLDSERPIHLGLYFPLHQRFVHWIYEVDYPDGRIHR